MIMLLKGVKKFVLSKLKILWKKNTSRKIAKLSWQRAQKENVWTVCS